MKKQAVFTAGMVVVLLISSCSILDVIGQGAVKSFDIMLKYAKNNFNPNTQQWELSAPGGEIFRMAVTYNTDKPDFTITADAAPFLAAGLDPVKLPSRFSFDSAADTLTAAFDLSNSKLPPEAAVSPLAVFREFVKVKRDAIGYHEPLDHFGIALGDGNMFEWAKDIEKNDKDLVFVLDPAPFIAAGLDTAKLTSWVYAEVPVMDKDGTQKKVPKLLKAYNIQ